jgi:hypothetical protein
MKEKSFHSIMGATAKIFGPAAAALDMAVMEVRKSARVQWVEALHLSEITGDSKRFEINPDAARA